MKRRIKKLLQAVCAVTFILAVLGCENADGTPNTAWILSMMTVCSISGVGFKKMEDESCR